MAAVLLLGACRACADQIAVHEHGVRTEVPAASTRGSALLETVDHAVERANDVLQLAVTPKLVADLRAKQTCVEIEYATLHTWKLAGLAGREVGARRVLIPLSGDFAGSPVTIFYDPGDGYAAGPLASPAGSAEILRLVQKP